jgi:hypothetical protein
MVVDKHGEVVHYAPLTKSRCFGPSSIAKPPEKGNVRKSSWIRYAVAVLGLVGLLTSAAKADTFVYEVTSTVNNLDVKFDLPSFQETVTTSTFTLGTAFIGPLTEFSLSGDSTDCSASGFLGTIMASGPCFIGYSATSFFSLVDPAFGFTGPGTFTVTDVDFDHGRVQRRAGAKLNRPHAARCRVGVCAAETYRSGTSAGQLNAAARYCIPQTAVCPSLSASNVLPNALQSFPL